MKFSLLKQHLLYALFQEEYTSLTALSRTLGTHRPAVSRAVHRLQDEGFVTVREGHRWVLTEQGLHSVKKKQQVYTEQILPLIEKARKLAECYDIPFLACFEVDGWLQIESSLEEAGSELRSAYGELTGDWN